MQIKTKSSEILYPKKENKVNFSASLKDWQIIYLLIFFLSFRPIIWQMGLSMKKIIWCGLIWCLSVFVTANAYSDYAEKSTEHTTVSLFHNGGDEVLARFSIQPDWHISWSNPGDVGQATTVTAENTKVDVLAQSTPIARTIYDFMHEYLYENTVYYLLKVDSLDETKLIFNFVECNDVCKPETLSFNLDTIIPTSTREWNILRQQADATFPQKIKLSGSAEDNMLKLDILPDTPVTFTPTQKDIIDETSIEIKQLEDGIQVQWQSEQPQQLQQALIMTPTAAYLADIEYTRSLSTVLWPFLGGILLNAMPCVFPILSLKILNLVKAPQTGNKPYINALTYTFGVLLSFMLLTVCLVWLKQQGENIGWGFQLQSPWFVGFMIVLFMVLFLFMIDVLHFPSFTTNTMHKLSAFNEFTTGFFAVLIASPCSGPFMGAAIGYAFTRSYGEIFAIFTALALGYALPYALIEIFPQTLHKILPKPGAWMQKLKYVLSIPILLTAIWLGAVLYEQVTENTETIASELDWQPFDAATIEQLNAQGENIFVDFTADWCLTCQFNEKVIINTERFKKFVQQNNVYLFVADLTEYNEQYSAALSAYGRDAIPLYVYYQNGNYRILPLFFKVSSLSQEF